MPTFRPEEETPDNLQLIRLLNGNLNFEDNFDVAILEIATDA